MESLLLTTPVKIPRPKFQTSRGFYPKEPPKDYATDDTVPEHREAERKESSGSYGATQLSKDLHEKL